MSKYRKFIQNQLVVASNNQGKIIEISRLLENFNPTLKVISAGDYNLISPEETGKTFKANAIIKAKYYCKKIGMAALADDSGLAVDLLDGRPGVYSARFAGIDGNFNMAMDKIEIELHKLGYNQSSARFICALALCWPDGHIEIFEGKIEGTVCFPRKGNNGFGYDPIFMPNGYSKTFGELDSNIKSKISHRADAFNQLIENCFQ